MVREFEVGVLKLLEHISRHRLDIGMDTFRVVLGDFRAQAPLSRIRNLLRSSKPDVGEVTVCVSGKRTRAAHAELLYRNLRVRQSSRSLGRLARSFIAMPGGQDLRIILFSLADQILQRNSRGSLCWMLHRSRTGFTRLLSIQLRSSNRRDSNRKALANDKSAQKSA